MQDCIYNTMDLNHPKFTHNGILGFGTSNKSSKNVNTFKYEDCADQLELSGKRKERLA